MGIEESVEEAGEKIRAPEGLFLVCVWDPSNPRKSVPAEQLRTSYKGLAISYAKRMNERWKKKYDKATPEEQSSMGEADYFVVDDKGVRIF